MLRVMPVHPRKTGVESENWRDRDKVMGNENILLPCSMSGSQVGFRDYEVSWAFADNNKFALGIVIGFRDDAADDCGRAVAARARMA